MQTRMPARLRGSSLGGWFGSALLVCWSCGPAANADGVPNTRAVRGQELFQHKWTPDDPQSTAGDGLGPLYNASSCAACHKLAAVGGAGPAANNVNLLSVPPQVEVAVPNDTPASSPISSRLAEVHPGLSPQNSILILHHFGPDAEYEALRSRLLGDGFFFARLAPARQAAMLRASRKRTLMQPLLTRTARVAGIPVVISQRNTPALFGAGLIDRIFEADLEEVAAEQNMRSRSGISGRVPRANQGGAGRFGWRGQTATLRDFVLGACANELGLAVPGHAQPPVPHDQDYVSPGLDLSLDQCDDLVAYVASLPAPEQLLPDDPVQARLVKVGEQWFQRIGCADCHRRSLGVVDGIYSDLLLHDMGPALEDPVPANPAPSAASTPSLASLLAAVGSYYGGSPATSAAASEDPRREWRTPPLWGVRDSGPYLHDGRAPTLDEAIRQHGGEAQSAVQRYRSLTSAQRRRILTFLDSLAAQGG